MSGNREHALRNFEATIDDLEAMIQSLQHVAPDTGRSSFDIGRARAVFLGDGLFVNRLIGAGLRGDLDGSDLTRFENESMALGQTPTVEVSSFADPSLASMLEERGYSVDDETTVLARPPEPSSGPLAHHVEIVTSETIDQWCEATAVGWGHAGTDRRAGSDLYGHAALAAQDPGLLLARSVEDGRVVGCAALAIVGDTAILGGMSTMPAERRTGVQSALIHARLEMAYERGCSLAVTQADAGSSSERNLKRHSFEHVDTLTSYEK